MGAISVAETLCQRPHYRAMNSCVRRIVLDRASHNATDVAGTREEYTPDVSQSEKSGREVKHIFAQASPEVDGQQAGRKPTPTPYPEGCLR